MWIRKLRSTSVTPAKRVTLTRISGLLFAALGMVFLSSPSWAQQWPTKSVRVVVNAPAGGAVDVVARLVGKHLSDRLGRPVIVDNKSGASGWIGVQDVLQSPPDGSTFLASVDSVLTEVPYAVKVNADPLRDVTPVVDLLSNGWLILSNNTMPAKDFPGLVAWAKAKPEGVNYGSFGTGTTTHLVALQLAKSAGLQMNHVPFRGGPDAMQALLSGQMPLLFGAMMPALPHIKSGKITALAFTGTERSVTLPDVPTVKELGFPELTAASWVGLWAHKDMPAPLRERIHKEVAQILSTPEVREKMMALGAVVAKPRASAELVKQMAIDSQRAGTVFRAAGLTPQ